MWSRRRFLSSLAAVSAASLVAGRRTGRRGRRGHQAGHRQFLRAHLRVESAAVDPVCGVLEIRHAPHVRPGSLREPRGQLPGQDSRQAAAAEIEIQVGTTSICPTSSSYDAKKWGPAEDHARLLIRTAHRLGSPVARCYLGHRGDRQGDGGIYRHIDAMVKLLKSVRSAAEDAQVKIAVENHAGDMQAWELVELIEAAGQEFVGATMDPGNAAWTMEDPLVNLEILGPYALTTGIRDTAVWETEEGAASMWVNMGQGVVDWPAYVRRFRELCPGSRSCWKSFRSNGRMRCRISSPNIGRSSPRRVPPNSRASSRSLNAARNANCHPAVPRAKHPPNWKRNNSSSTWKPTCAIAGKCWA